MEDLEKDIKQLSVKIEEIVEEAKMYSIYDFIQEGIKITTIRRFKQKEKSIFSISSDTIKNICLVIDNKSTKNKSYFYEINDVLSEFVESHIDILDNKTLMEIGITKVTFDKMRRNKLGLSYNLNTLIKYARIIDDWRGNQREESIQS
ncbi:hypothetical protein [Staphylococcus shinii]|uniref:hypothetical protein n=1 Tax=Staphylococcus shinii TaxID=2912228 RepID=UPI003EED3DE9